MLDRLPPKSTDDVTVIILGMEADAKLDRNARRTCEAFCRAGLETYHLDYSQIARLPALNIQETVVVLPFFPHTFWDEHCETPPDGGLYGTSTESFQRFQTFCIDADRQLRQHLGDRRIVPIVDMATAFWDRDKRATTDRLSAAGIETPTPFAERTAKEIADRIEPDAGIFIKCRFGAEGKGITYLSANGWWTNYAIENDRLTNYGVRDRWTFTEITHNLDLLSQLLAQEVVVEREIVTPEIEPDSKFDMRAYAIAAAVPHLFLRINSRAAHITNYSQGARVEHRYTEILPNQLQKKIQDLAAQTAACLDCPFVGVDLMLDRQGQVPVVETQVFSDFPDPLYFNLPAHFANMVRARFWESTR